MTTRTSIALLAAAMLTSPALAQQDCGRSGSAAGGTLTAPKPCKPGADARQPAEALRKRDVERKPDDKSGFYIGIGGSISTDTRFRVR
jgi:hypothetical protein